MTTQQAKKTVLAFTLLDEQVFPQAVAVGKAVGCIPFTMSIDLCYECVKMVRRTRPTMG